MLVLDVPPLESFYFKSPGKADSSNIAEGDPGSVLLLKLHLKATF